ncbi:heparan-alpha-glucosaminide N-acetyltransferase [Carboxydochorda subterranea]|uniref:Heparan-alpha-glucosaminide N-acetyltransferase n=1 Tax=Carboxydichorda subterranea TaxID=3109565 RepID=A0ABZ1BXS7_9FIRM|nr:heparan-alpha-glucosaminide N-acetyltransferase [Limnochorda sp. L945t]WRP17430.1 heparan-alpha-glucosaminide N-acetyltransferase [Limnochorda sp. L945t]
MDALRGIAVAGMVAYHFMWDLNFFGLSSVDVTRGAWRVVARAGAAIFLLLVGVSLNLAASRRPSPAYERQWRARGLKLWGWALLISVVTRQALGEWFVLFGILHLIGTALLLAPLLWRWRHLSAVLGAAMIAGGQVARHIPVSGPWLVPLGLAPAGYQTVDYFPVLPWLGVVVAGLYLGQRLDLVGRWLAAHGRAPLLLVASPPVWLRPACSMGRHSLAIYLLHQPLLLAGFWICGYSIW